MAKRREVARLPGSSGTVAAGAGWFVWCVWGSMLLAALGFVARFGSDVPYWDEWNLVPILTGEHPVDAAWLWSEHNGHRIPLPRLLLLAAFKVSGSDFRVGMYANVLVLAALAFAMIMVARRARGRSSYADAFFPLVLLHWGHYENFLWSWQLTQVTPVVLASILLICIVRWGLHLPFGIAVLAGLCLVMLPLCGIPGLVYVPALSIWLASVGVLYWRSSRSHGRWMALVIWCLTAVAVLLMAVYLVGYREPGRLLPALDAGTSMIPFLRALAGSLLTGLQFLAGGLGPAAEVFWPLSGLVVLGLFLLTTGVLLRAALGAGSVHDRSRALGLLLFLLAVACLALSVGLGRRGYGFTPRYLLLAAPALCWGYFAWACCSPPATRRLAQVSLLCLAALAMPLNYTGGMKYAHAYSRNMNSFRNDLLAGEPIPLLLARHAHSLHPCPFGGEPTHGEVAADPEEVPPESKLQAKRCISFHAWLDDRLRALKRAEIGHFRFLQPKVPASREVPLLAETIARDPITAGGTAIQRTRDDQNLILGLNEPSFVYGIRVRYRGGLHADRSGRPPCLQVFWKRGDQEEFTRPQRYILYLGPEELTETIWIYGEIDGIRINLENNFANIDRLQVSLLVPAGG